ncbi:glycerophosphoryl diester phosphodiesterase membrane domain-containing protein [Paenibacillus sp. TRM 82003]|uniref:glycerophosphoryl diester phosphodiesterase membrane domain-containing protein n=1 Tax=Kineococcus sp. TRM81007 TaxID=2925831 RepID=UPI001F5A1499|nr:glycerophosphoryl diester phosphodiesterase membrane domain-containing protein [Kineococcus sp. TRM81007]MCI2237885.1 glycerophosphoryl diester phosphodiesterase membrane domain-containing protein [Kineococcus sp. TRM81007]MCI3924616.1 glycerophosphoryl diester phosphodiesterase membrane domain-containing protein [Paenibacillus sp. TRM 82003]
MSQWQGPEGGWTSPGGGRGPGGDDPGAAPPPVADGAGAPAGAGWTGTGWSGGGWEQQPAAAPRPGIVPLRPLGLGEIWDGAFRAFRQNPRVMVGLSALVVVVTSLVTLVATVLVTRDLVRASTAVETGTGDASVVLDAVQTSVPLFAVSTLLQVVAVQVLNGMLILSVSRAVLGRTISLAELWRSSRRRLGGLVLVSVLVTLASVAGAVALAPGVAVLALVDGTAGAATGAVLLLAGLLGWAAVAAWLWVKWSMATPALLLEGLSARRAMGRSWRLTRGAFWRTLGILLLTAVVVGAVVTAVSVPFSLVGGFLGAFVDGGASTRSLWLSQGVGTLGSIVGSVVAYPFLASVTALVYVDLRMRREGLDVELHRAAAGG